MRFQKWFGLVAVLWCFVAVTASAQTVNVTSGSINGVVADSSGAVLPGVSVTATSLDTGLARTVTTEKDGAYVINLLPPGRYRVDAELSGLGKARIASVDVLLGNSTRANLKIAPQLTETVEVVASSVDSSRTGAASSVTSEQIANLPILGRDFRSLAALTPGIVDAFGGRVTANGARGVSTDYNIDGATSNNDFFGENTGGTRAPFTFSQAAIREFQVVRSQYDAEFGRGVGAQVNAVTKSGTNDLHGEGFLFRRNRDWATSRPSYLGDCAFDANGGAIFNDPTHPTCRSIVDSFRAKDSTQAGFAVGGPIQANRLFFFGNFDSQRQKLPITPTDIRNLAGFAALTSTDQQLLLDRIGGLVGHPYQDELVYNTTFNQNTYLGKVDANLNGSTRLSLRNNYTNFENGNNQATGQLSNQGVENDKFNQLVAQVTKVLGNSAVNETLGEFSFDERPIAPTATVPEFRVSIGGTAVNFGQNDFLPNNTKERKFQIKDTFRFTRGNHSLKIGGEVVSMHIDNLFPRFSNGQFFYSNVANFLANTTSGFQMGYGAGGGVTSWTQSTFAFYLSDNLRVNRRLTIDWGLRYDTQTMPKPEVNAFPQHAEFVNNIKPDLNNIAPRFGFAYDMSGDGRSVIRGGGGRFFGYMPSILLSNPLTQISGNFSQINIANCAAAGLVLPCPAFPTLYTPAEFGQVALLATDVVTISPDYEAQEAWRGNVQYERQLARGYSAAVGVIFSKMTHVQGTRNINAVSTGVALAGMPIYDPASTARRYTDMGVVRELFSGEEASYKAFTLETRKMTSERWLPSWDLSYTLASSIDQDSNERSTSTSFLWDPLNPSLSEGPSDNDVRHRFVGNAIYKLPYGVQLSAIFQARSGLPYTPNIFRGSPASSSLNGLTQMSGNIGVFLDADGNIIDLTLANGFNRTQLAQFLNDRGARLAGRNSSRQPAWYTLDLRIAKTFNVTAGSRHTQVQLVGEAFNVLATRNEFIGATNQSRFNVAVSGTNTYTFTNVAAFGLTNGYAATPDPRQAQVAVKFIF